MSLPWPRREPGTAGPSYAKPVLLLGWIAAEELVSNGLQAPRFVRPTPLHTCTVVSQALFLVSNTP